MPRKAITLSAALLVLALGGGLAWANAPDSEPLPPGARADRVLVDKGDRSLTLLRDGRPLKTYRVALGGAPAGHKRQEGDERTPEGTYLLDYRKEDSSAHRALHVSYPNPADEARAKERGVQPGGFIMVHGITDGLGWGGEAAPPARLDGRVRRRRELGDGRDHGRRPGRHAHRDPSVRARA